jgi:hypothetical protein
MQIHILERFPVIHIARSKDKVQDFPLIVDNQVELETIEPAGGALPFFDDTFKCLMLFLPFYVTAVKRGGVNKEIPVHLPVHIILTNKDRQGHTDFALQFYQTIAGYGIGEIFLHMLLYIKRHKNFSGS